MQTLAEYFRLKYVHGPRLTLSLLEPYITGALLDAVLCFVAVGLFFFRRYRSALIVSVATIILLLAYKLCAIGWP